MVCPSPAKVDKTIFVITVGKAVAIAIFRDELHAFDCEHNPEYIVGVDTAAILMDEGRIDILRERGQFLMATDDVVARMVVQDNFCFHRIACLVNDSFLEYASRINVQPSQHLISASVRA